MRRPNRRRALPALAMLITPMLAAHADPLPPPEPYAEMIKLSIDGTPGTRYQGSLSVTTQGDTKTHALEGSVPTRQTFTGEHASLEMTQQSAGSLTIELIKNGNRSTSHISGPGSRIRVSVN